MVCQHSQEIKELKTRITELQQKLETEREETQQWRRMCESAPDYMSIVDSERRFIWVNRTHPSLARQPLQTRRLDDFCSSNSLERAKAAIAACKKSTDPVEYIAHYSVDGEEAWARTRALNVNNAPKQTLLVTSDITVQIRAEQAQRESIERLKSALKVARLGYWEWNLLTGKHYWSDEVYEFLEANANSVQPDRAAFLDRIHPQDQARLQSALQSILSGKEKFYALEFRRVHSQGEIRHFILRGDVVCDEDGQALKVRSSLMDTTLTCEAKKAALCWESRFKAAIQAAGQVVYDWDIETGRVEFVGAQSQFWTTKEQVPQTMAHWEASIVPADQAQAMRQHLAIPEGQVGYEIEYRIQHGDGIRHLQEYAEPIVERNGRQHVVGLITDVSFRVARESGLADKVKRQNALLREVHHRAKNNLQLVASLIQLHRKEADNSKVLLARLGGLVRAMSLVHEQLYRTTNMGRVELNRYGQSLIEYIHSAHADERVPLKFVLSPESIVLDPEHATPFGLILIGELLGLYERAAQDGSSSIRVNVTEEQGHLSLCISGRALQTIGRPSSKLGFRLTEILTQQLAGKLKRQHSPEELITIQFPVVHLERHSDGLHGG